MRIMTIASVITKMLAGCEEETRKSPLGHVLAGHPELDGLVQTCNDSDRLTGDARQNAKEEHAKYQEALDRTRESAIGDIYP